MDSKPPNVPPQDMGSGSSIASRCPNALGGGHSLIHDTIATMEPTFNRETGNLLEVSVVRPRWRCLLCGQTWPG